MDDVIPNPLGRREVAWMYTASGNIFRWWEPTPESITIEDIAHHLATINRWGGAARFPISVAQHSLMVCSMVPPEHKLQGLLHDAAEAYLGDIVRPFKSCLLDYTALEEKLLKAIFAKLGVRHPLHSSVGLADDIVLAWEYRDAMPDDVPVPDVVASHMYLTPKKIIQPMGWEEAETRFLAAFRYYTNRRDRGAE